MPKPTAPCGTKPAYDRHLRNKEPIDDACRRANTVAKRQQRDSARKPSPGAEPEPFVEPVEASRESDLDAMRDVLWRSIQYATAKDPTRVSGLTKELREVWKELEAIRGEEKQEVDSFDSFIDGGNVVGFPNAANS